MTQTLADLCDGHESLSGAHMGESVYCDGRCQRHHIAFLCKECGQVWTIWDDPDEWTSGHDCEAH